LFSTTPPSTSLPTDTDPCNRRFAGLTTRTANLPDRFPFLPTKAPHRLKSNRPAAPPRDSCCPQKTFRPRKPPCPEKKFTLRCRKRPIKVHPAHLHGNQVGLVGLPQQCLPADRTRRPEAVVFFFPMGPSPPPPFFHPPAEPEQGTSKLRHWQVAVRPQRKAGQPYSDRTPCP